MLGTVNVMIRENEVLESLIPYTAKYLLNQGVVVVELAYIISDIRADK